MLENLFDKTNQGNIAKSVEHFAHSFENLENTTGTLDTLMQSQKVRIEKILENIESISLSLKSNQDNFDNIMSNFSSLSDTLAKARITETLLSASKAMDEFSEIAAGINRGEGSLGMLVKDDSLYIHLQKSARDLDLLLEDIRKNPKKYVKVSVF
jgi:phospholipid/cholesterol/gamma-HCH transport system substrate-binding protein